MQVSPKKILIIRRDNIGDLVCTLPCIARLREHHPQAWIGAFVTRYNAEVLHKNPDINEIFVYQKAKHLAQGESAVAAMWHRIKQLWRLRKMKLDYVVLPASGSQESARRMAKWIGAKKIVLQDDFPLSAQITHEVERTANVLHAFNLPTQALPPARIYPREEALTRMKALLRPEQSKLLGIHISSRKPSQRWATERFLALMQQLHAQDGTWRFVLFWSPGDEKNSLHPGDDHKAKQILDQASQHGLPLIACPTQNLGELIAALYCVHALVCSDGGHMHLAAGLGKPIVCLFGESDTQRWYPWGVPHSLIQASSKSVNDISVEEVVQGLSKISEHTHLA